MIALEGKQTIIIKESGVTHFFNRLINEAAKHKRAPRLLVIDDDKSVLFAVRRLLDKTGLQVDTSEDFEDAKKHIDSSYYDVILTDLKFSEVIDEAGLVISRYAKDRLPDVKIILWTGMECNKLIDKVKNAKIDLCLSKPISPKVILRILQNLHFL